MTYRDNGFFQVSERLVIRLFLLCLVLVTGVFVVVVALVHGHCCGAAVWIRVLRGWSS